MPAESTHRIHPHAMATMMIVAALFATWFAYAPGIAGSLHFDDRINLSGLADVHDGESALMFIAVGKGGPLGRPLALASFVPQAYAWPGSTDVFLRTNILIHLLNGVLVTWFLYLLGRIRRQTEQQAALIAVGGGTIWMLMPLLASSSLFIVQRMTTLSALFTLLGVIGYLYARQMVDRRPIAALLGMTLALGVGGTLGILVKENAALIFLFILAIEFSLFDRPPSVSKGLWRTWFTVVLMAPLVAVTFYLVSVLPYSEGVVLRRDFTGLERLITQAEILWKYVYLAFVPNIPSLGPFHDDYAVRRSLLDFPAMLAVAAWIAAITAAVMLRRRARLFTFAVIWYLLGHLLESTTLSLELYFEHRNYMPLIGPVYALVASLLHLDRPLLRIAAVGAIVYAGLLGGVLFSATSLWGSPVVAAEMWHIYKPQSVRAVEHLAGVLEQQGEPYSTQRLLVRYLENNPESDSVRLQLLIISCQLEPWSNHGDAIRVLQGRLPATQFSLSIPAGIHQLYQLERDSQCPGIEPAAIYKLGDNLLENPAFSVPIIRHNIHVAMASIGVDAGDFGLAMSNIESALNAYHNPDTLEWAVDVLTSAGRYDISRELFAEAQDRKPPRNPLAALKWKRALDRIETVILDGEQSDKARM